MSYISAIRDKDRVIVWERTSNNERIIKIYDAPFYYYTKDENGSYVDLYGKKLKKVEFDSYDDFKKAKGKYYDNKGYGHQSRDSSNIYESDIAPELKILSEHYYQKPAPKLNITFYDLEVNYDPGKGFPNPENYYAPINALALYNSWENKITAIAVPPNGTKAIDWNKDDIIQQMENEEPFQLNYELILVDEEKELLKIFVEKIQNCDLICGWNSEGFDNPYVARRIEEVLGKKYFNMLSFEHAPAPKYREYEKYGNNQTTVDFFGRISTDYLEIYKKYKVVLQPSYKLESIAEQELPKMRKLEYSGTLYTLYRENFPKFIRYNIRDTEILYELENKLGYIGVANELYHSSTALFPHILGTLQTTQLAIVNYCHHELGIIVNDIKQNPENSTFAGAYVLEPKVGMHDWIGSMDIASLYPSSIRALNISPEMIIGQCLKYEKDFELIRDNSDKFVTMEMDKNSQKKSGKHITLPAKNWKLVLKKLKWAISGYGTVFNQVKKGVLPAVLEEWYDTRKEYKRLSAKYKNEAQEILSKYGN